MNHPTADELLLFVYDELPAPRAVAVESHVEVCPACQTELRLLERGRAALDSAVPARRSAQLVGATLAIAAAAVLAGVAIVRSGPPRTPGESWTPTATWSATAGYVTGGKAMVDIDVQLTRLERERTYGLPN